MRQIFVIGLLTMMKASNAIYRYDEEDYVPADVDGAVLMAASYTKGLPIEDPVKYPGPDPLGSVQSQYAREYNLPKTDET